MITDASRMKASAERSAATNHRTWVVANLLVLCLGLLGPNAALADNLVIEGSKLPWTAEFPGYWFGGTAESMERVLARTSGADWTDQTLKVLIREMLPEAKSLDAIFFHMDVTGMKTETVSSLRVNVITSIEQLPEESGRKAIWKSYGQRLTTEYPEESKVAEKGDRIAITAGREAYEGTFLITRIKGRGERRFFDTRQEAEGWAQLQRVKRQNDGGKAFDDRELAAYGWNAQDAIRFALKHLARQSASVPVAAAANGFN